MSRPCDARRKHAANSTMGCGSSSVKGQAPNPSSARDPGTGVDDPSGRQLSSRMPSGGFGLPRSTRSGSFASSSMPSAGGGGVAVLSMSSGSYGSPNGGVGVLGSGSDTQGFMLSDAEMRDLRRTIEQRDPGCNIAGFSVPLPRRDRQWPLGAADGSSSYKSVSFGCKPFAVDLRREGRRLIGSRSKVRCAV
jgi:hypothetical protein